MLEVAKLQLEPWAGQGDVCAQPRFLRDPVGWGWGWEERCTGRWLTTGLLQHQP